MNPRLILIPLLGLGIATTQMIGCTQRESGTVVGGVVGGALGNQFGHGAGNVAMTAVGAIAGAMIGGAIGQNMDDTDQLKAMHAMERSRTNESTTWVNPDSGNRYTVTPTRTYDDGGRHCRDYSTRAYIGGRQELVHGTACRQSDGSWVAAN
jgi:surface antigen